MKKKTMTDVKSNEPARRLAFRGTIAGVAVVALIVVAFLVGRSIRSPAEVAATARAPALSLITVAVRKRVLAQETVFRGDVGATGALPVGIPQLPAGSNAVVTSTNSHQGDLVTDGSVLVSIAGRPIIVLKGTVPAFRTMEYGDSGVDVRQLQQGLLDLGYGIGDDQSGVFGPGTSASVQWMYDRAGYSPIAGPDQTSTTPQSPQSSPTPGTHSWSVPLGEVVFVPNAPVRVAQDSLEVGQTVAMAGTSATGESPAATGTLTSPQGAESNQGILSLGTGGIVVTGQIAEAQATTLRKGMVVELNDDVTGGSWKAVVEAIQMPDAQSQVDGQVPQATVSVVPDPTSNMPTSEIGQNIRVTVIAAKTQNKVYVVPISAIYSRPDGRTYVSILGSRSRRDVPVSVGLDANGEVQITSRKVGELHAGDEVVIGSTSLATSTGS